ncbi:MAG: chorismate mutase [Alphaproteobacteria bacterium]
MSDPVLDQLRQEIDRVDDEIHDLLMRRADLGEQVAAAKDNGAPGQPRFRPGREARILRRLKSRHNGPLPFSVVGHIWREVISSFLRRQSDLEVMVWGGASRISVWDLARAHFGVAAPFQVTLEAVEALDKTVKADNAVAVLAFETEGEPWWRLLSDDRPGAGLQIIARLPFFENAPADAFVVGKAREDSGDDTTLVMLHDLPKPPPGALDEAAGDALIAVPGFLVDGDDAIAALSADHGAARATVIGGYANPIPAN